MNNSAAQTKNNKNKKLAPVDIEVTEMMEQIEIELCKKVRNMRKKIKQIDELKEKSKGELNEEQKNKIAGKKAQEEELGNLEQNVRDYRAKKAHDGGVLFVKHLQIFFRAFFAGGASFCRGFHDESPPTIDVLFTAFSIKHHEPFGR